MEIRLTTNEEMRKPSFFRKKNKIRVHLHSCSMILFVLVNWYSTITFIKRVKEKSLKSVQQALVMLGLNFKAQNEKDLDLPI